MAEKSGENNVASATHGASAALAEGLRRILRPLVRLLIARQLTFPWAADVLRGLYVQVALREFPVEGKRQTDSRITLLTCVHRKDVKRLRGQRATAVRAPRAASLGAQLIARWTALPEYLDEHGQPRPLPRLAAAVADAWEELRASPDVARRRGKASGRAVRRPAAQRRKTPRR